MTGYEYALSPDSLVGVLASAFKSYVDLEGSAGEIDSNTYSLGVFGQHLLGSVKVTGIFLASYSQYDSERFVSVGGISGSPKVEYDGWGTSTTVGVSKLFEHEQVKIEPFVNANFSTASTEDYSETGGGVYNMDVSSDTSSSTSVRTGFTLEHNTDVSGYNMTLKAKPYVGYQWELNEANNAVRLSGSASSVVLNGRDINSAEVGLGLEAAMKLSETDSVKVGAEYSHDRNEDSGIAYVGYGLKF